MARREVWRYAASKITTSRDDIAALYMGASVATRRDPVIRAFYHRLVAAGKPKKLALTAL
jgi:hypothetical protein